MFIDVVAALMIPPHLPAYPPAGCMDQLTSDIPHLNQSGEPVLCSTSATFWFWFRHNLLLIP
jgi:hypothetical protein